MPAFSVLFIAPGNMTDRVLATCAATWQQRAGIARLAGTVWEGTYACLAAASTCATVAPSTAIAILSKMVPGNS